MDAGYLVLVLWILCDVVLKPFSVKFFETLAVEAAKRTIQRKVVERSSIIIVSPIGRK